MLIILCILIFLLIYTCYLQIRNKEILKFLLSLTYKDQAWLDKRYKTIERCYMRVLFSFKPVKTKYWIKDKI